MFSKNTILGHPINKCNKNNSVLWYGQLTFSDSHKKSE